jgi:Penicillin amidase
MVVNNWVSRYEAEGINGLQTKPGRGRKAILDAHKDAAKIKDESTLYSDIFYNTPWTAENPYTTPDGLANPELAIAALESAATTLQGQLDLPWGDSYVAVVEFSNPIKAQVLNTYGNSSQGDSIHAGDQLSLATEQQLRPVWRGREEILQHLAEQISSGKKVGFQPH